jgi:4-aminobutyrate aminotransferase-like enzyme
MERRSQIGDVRGHGMMIALELVKDRRSKQPFTAKETYNLTVDLALLGLVLSNHANNLGLMPPLIIDETLADEIVHIIDRGLDKGFVEQLGMKARMLTEFTASKLRP